MREFVDVFHVSSHGWCIVVTKCVLHDVGRNIPLNVHGIQSIPN
jgi:hypothetical protein